MIKSSLAALGIGVMVLCLAPAGCGSDSKGGGPPGGSGGSSGDGGGGVTGSGICLLNNCNSDAECEGCSFGRTTCDLAEKRCIACDPVNGTGCKEGEECTSFGTCAPKGLECPTNAGEPTITCATDADCLACDPLHQKCDTATSKCVACVAGATESCTGSQTCTAAGSCEQKCPVNCASDAECANCTNGGKQANACNNHVCAECSDTKPCVTGLECQKGTCVKPCGKAGSPTEGGGECQQDAECYGCGNTEATTVSWTCKFPINGGTHGTCAVPAEGCTDLAKTGAVLPPPFDAVTNLCSTDANCANVSIDLNVGKIIRDLVGDDELNLGLKTVKINDAVLKYNMSKCADVEIKDGDKCGVCVPCESDIDCKPIAIDPLIDQLFGSDLLAKQAAAFLMDLLYGKGTEHEIHMQCLPVAQGYGVCAPCSNPTQACGTGSGGQTGSGKCEHNVCETGTALDPTCGLCAAAVCLEDFYCCTVGWDDLCKQKVNDVCAVGCDGTTSCTHQPCQVGTSLHEACSPCTAEVCQFDPYCCNLQNGQWDDLCVQSAQGKASCTPECSGGGSCVHSECELGSKLDATCSACATEICNRDAFCCEKEWDKFCVLWAQEAQVQAICNCPP